MPRILSGEEEAVLKAIFDQRAKSQWSSIFKYDAEEAQLFLHSIGAFSKYKLEKDKQFGIIDRLTNDGIIKSDYLVNVTFFNNLRIATHSKEPLIESDEKYYWLRNTDWARRTFGPNEFKSIEEVGKEHDGALVINMTVDDMNYIEENYMASHTVWLTLTTDKEDCAIKIKFDKEDWREIYRMKKNKTTSKILCLAFKYVDKEVKTKYKYLESKTFKKNGPVQALNPTLIMLDGDKITFKTRASVTPTEFERLKKALKIS